METTRHIGVDLHRNCFTACIRLENGKHYVTEWKLEQLPKFVAKLRPSGEWSSKSRATRGCFTMRWRPL